MWAAMPPTASNAFGVAYNSRKNEAPAISNMAGYEISLSAADPSRVEKLRSPGYNRCAGVGELRDILEGHEPYVAARPGLGQREQRRGIQQSELPLGVAKTKLSESTEHFETGRLAGELPGHIEELGDKEVDYVLSDKPRVDMGEDVFDILNCGPHHRFVVIGDGGHPLVASNCVQATARDVLGHYIRILAEEGMDIRLHVHDEIVIMCDEAEAPDVLKRALEVMSVPPPWIADLPIEADGSFHNRYTK